MSTLTENLPHTVIQKWRNWASDPAFQTGIDFLRHRKAPRVPRDATAEDKRDGAVAWQAYHEALNDIEDVLTVLPDQGGSLDEPSIRQ